jgi:hypothetical protein
MQPLTPEGRQAIENIAQRHGFSTDAVVTMLQAVLNGHGTMAQFNHAEFGGSGQWMQGGMVMVGDMFNNALKARVDTLCNELSGLLASQRVLQEPPPATTTPAPGAAPNVSLFVPGSTNQGNWWPSDLGAASSTGSQNDVRYAVFPATRRLAVEIGGQVTVYDTLDHQIGGVSQQQGGGSTVTFTSQYGVVRVSDLPVVSGAVKASSPPPAAELAEATTDVFAQIEKLAELHQKGVLSAEEFATKKAELLQRI